MVPASFASATFRRAGAPGKLPIGLIVLLLCLGQVVLWGIATAYAYKAPELDSAEQFIWSFALEGGYWKHPPVPSWIMHFLVAVFGPSVPLPYIATQVAIVTAMALTWRLACEFMTPQRALIAMLLTSLVTYHNIGGDNYNHNTVLLPFQAAMALCFFLAARRASVRWWLLAGVFAGLSLLVKYVAAMPIAGLLLYFLLDRSLHQRRNVIGLALATLAGLLVLLPHVLWVIDTRYMIFNYARMTVHRTVGWFGFLHTMAAFLGMQLVRLGPLLLALGLFIRLGGRTRPATARPQAGTLAASMEPAVDKPLSGPVAGTAPAMASASASALASAAPIELLPALAARDRLFIWLGAIMPLLLTLAFSLVSHTDLESRWGANVFLFSGMLAMMLVRRTDDRFVLRAMLLATVVLQTVLTLGLILGKSVISEHYQHRTRANFPGQLLASETEKAWQAHTSAPLRIVVSDLWIGGNMIANTRHRLAVLMFGIHRISPWVSPAQLHDCGAMLLEDRSAEPFLPPGEYPEFETLRANADERGEFTLPWAVGSLKNDPHPHNTIRWAYITPKAPSRCTIQ